jgi:hypothetical protein
MGVVVIRPRQRMFERLEESRFDPKGMVWVLTNERLNLAKTVRIGRHAVPPPLMTEEAISRHPQGLNFCPLFVVRLLRHLERTAHPMEITSAPGTLGTRRLRQLPRLAAIETSMGPETIRPSMKQPNMWLAQFPVPQAAAKLHSFCLGGTAHRVLMSEKLDYLQLLRSRHCQAELPRVPRQKWVASVAPGGAPRAGKRAFHQGNRIKSRSEPQAVPTRCAAGLPEEPVHLS